LKKILTLKLYITLWETYSKRIVFLCWSNVFTQYWWSPLYLSTRYWEEEQIYIAFIWKYFIISSIQTINV